jgi:hypothetical protein
MIKDAFQDNLWNSVTVAVPPTVNFPTVATPLGEPFNQMEANFSLFWGLAIQLYEATLVADNTPFVRFLGGDQTALTPQQQNGFNTFFGAGRCSLCHVGTELTGASVRAAGFLNNATNNLLEQMNVASGRSVIYDGGFNNTGARPLAEDIGRGGNSTFTNPLTNLPIPLSFSLQAELQAANNLPFAAPQLLANIPVNPPFPVGNDNAFKMPGLRNVELTAPYFHNGSVMTLGDVVDFYTRGGNFPTDNAAFLDVNIAPIGALQNNPNGQADLVAFLMSMTDERVRNQSAPFDHPEIMIPEGDPEVLTRIPARDALGNTALPSNFKITALASPTNKASQVVSGTNDAGATVQFKIGNGPLQPANTPPATTWSVTVSGLSEGANPITVTQVDAQLIQTILSDNITLDTNPPALTIAPVTPPTIGASLTLTGTVEAGVTPVVTVNTKAQTGPVTVNGVNWSCRLSGLLAGANDVTVVATDAAGNATTNTTSLTVIIPDGNFKTSGNVDISDALRALRIAVGIIQPTADDMLHGDVAPLGAPDGVIDIADAVLILKKVLGVFTF